MHPSSTTWAWTSTGGTCKSRHGTTRTLTETSRSCKNKIRNIFCNHYQISDVNIHFFWETRGLSGRAAFVSVGFLLYSKNKIKKSYFYYPGLPGDAQPLWVGFVLQRGFVVRERGLHCDHGVDAAACAPALPHSGFVRVPPRRERELRNSGGPPVDGMLI